MKKLLYLPLVFIALTGWSQQTPLYSQYFLNPYLYNPSVAGVKGSTHAFMLYRNHWVGVNGSPETFAFTLDGKLKKHPIGLGLSVVNDVNNVIGRTNFGVSGAYYVQLAPKQTLSFGLSGQAIQNRVYFERIRAEDIDDPNLLNSIDQRTAFEMGAGLSYQWKTLRVGVASDQLMQNGVTFESSNQFQQLDFNFVRHYFGTIQYRFHLSRNFDLEPLLLTRVVQGLPTQFDLNLLGTYQDKIWAATTYRHDVGVAFAFGFKVQQQLTFGYSYEIPTTDIRVLGGASHELVVGWRFSLSQPATETTQPAGMNRKTRKLADLQEENAVHHQELDELKLRNEKISQQLQESNKRFDQQQQEIDLLKEQLTNHKQEIGTIRQQSIEEIENLSADAKGEFYVVIGAFKTLRASKNFQQVIKRKKGPETRIIQNTGGSFYFIYTEQYDQASDALQALKTVIGDHIADEITGNPWIYYKEDK